MTDKQIIIDDVDVSGWTDEEVHYKFAKHSSKAIRQIAFDLYKQLKRKERECEELKNIINEAKNSKLDLKSFLVGEAVQNEYEQQLNQLKAENYLYKNAHKTEQDRRRSYENALTEIKEIAETENNDIKVLYNRRTYQRMKQILQKIREVEDEHNG